MPTEDEEISDFATHFLNDDTHYCLMPEIPSRLCNSCVNIPIRWLLESPQNGYTLFDDFSQLIESEKSCDFCKLIHGSIKSLDGNGIINIAVAPQSLIIEVTKEGSFNHSLLRLCTVLGSEAVSMGIEVAFPILPEIGGKLYFKLLREWLHPLLPRLYIYIFAVTFLATFLLQYGLIAWRNRAAGRSCPRASISHVNDIVKIRLSLSRPLEVKAGQHIELWIPLDFWSLWQCHPFVVTSWSEGAQSTLDLFIEPRRGFTQKLLQHGYNSCKTRTRRVHLVWQLETLDIGIAVESLLNDALADDTLDEGYIPSISIYIESGKADRVPFGRRAIVDSGTADLTTILQEEAAGKFIKRVQEETEERGGMLVMVSGTDQLRDQLRDEVRGYLDDKVRLWELEYQPA